MGANLLEAETRLISTLWFLNFIQHLSLPVGFHTKAPFKFKFWAVRTLTLLEDKNSHDLVRSVYFFL